MSEIDATLVKNGQKVVATVSQSGTIISDPSAVDATALIQTDDGPQLCVKTFDLNGGGGGGGDVPDNVYTQDNLVAGTNISITAVPQPVIDANTLGVWHLDSSADNVVGDATITLALTPAYYNTTSYKFGTASARFYQSSSAQFFSNYSTVFQNDFTLDLWARTRSNNGSDAEIIFGAGYGGSSCAFSVRSTYIDVKIGSSTPRTNTVSQSWHHIAIVRSNGVLYAFLDGLLQGTTNAPGTDNYISLYSPSNNDAEMLLDEIRVSNVARWTADFTPFSQPYQEDSGNPVYQINNTQDLSSYLQNTATGTNALTILGASTRFQNSINIGAYSSASSLNTVAIGSTAQTTSDYSVAIGNQAYTSGYRSVALGHTSKTNGVDAIQLGVGTNSTAKTFQVYTYQLLDGNTGLIPPERLGTGYDATKTQVLKHVNGVLTWVDEA